MSVREPDWAGFRQAVTARQRPIMEGLAEFLRLDTVSQKPDRVRTGAEWLRRAMQARGLEAHVLETGGNPAVYGSLPVPEAERTLLIYCHYDVKPAPPEGWLQTSPFEPVLRARAAEEGAPVLRLGDVADEALPRHRLYGRGASDDKGPIWAHLTAVELMRELGVGPRVAVKFIFDGEEEMGSPHFGPFTERHRDLLAADLVLVTDGPNPARPGRDRAGARRRAPSRVPRAAHVPLHPDHPRPQERLHRSGSSDDHPAPGDGGLRRAPREEPARRDGIPAHSRAHPGPGLHGDRVARRPDPGRPARARDPGGGATGIRPGQDRRRPAGLPPRDRGGGASPRRRARGGPADHGRQRTALGLHRHLEAADHRGALRQRQ